MIERGIKRLTPRALVVDDELGMATAEGRAARALVQELQARNVEVVEANSAEDGTSVIASDSAIHVVLIDWTLGGDKNHAITRGASRSSSTPASIASISTRPGTPTPASTRSIATASL